MIAIKTFLDCEIDAFTINKRNDINIYYFGSFIHEDNDHDSIINDDLHRRKETILLLVPVLSLGLVHTKLSNVSTEQQIIAELSDSYIKKNIYIAKNVTKLSDVSTEQLILTEWSDSNNNKNKNKNI